ncbi:MAG: hypothetical protein CVV27_19385, partial [Candidatus Melainabacteria bacterium HGW-Melainabacteria-1]
MPTPSSSAGPASPSPDPRLSPSATPSGSASPSASAPNETLTRIYRDLERGHLYKLHIQPEQRHYYQIRTEPGKHYTLKSESGHTIQQIYFGSQPDVPLGMTRLPLDLKMEFQAEHDAYYLILTSQQTRDYELIFDDFIPPPSPTPYVCEPVWSCYAHNTVSGRIFDDGNQPLDHATVRIRALNSDVPFDKSYTTVLGSYQIHHVPMGVQVEISASKAGYTSRRRVEVIRTNNSDIYPNRYDFGADGGSSQFGVAYNALSDKPEVIGVIPGRNAAGIDPQSGFTLKFSEPMDQTSVLENFEIRAFTSERLTVDTRAEAKTVTGSGNIDQLTGTRIWDQAAFSADWNAEHTQVTFSFKPDHALPTDRDSDKVPDYQVSLNRGTGIIRDKSGIGRYQNERKFKLTDGEFERSYKFSILTDANKPG